MTGTFSESSPGKRVPSIALDPSRLESVYLDSVNLERLAGDEFQIFLDSREVAPGGVFIGIKGEHRDGSAFALEALERGVSCVVVGTAVWEEVRQRAESQRRTALLVDDTTRFLGEIARWKAQNLGLVKVGITGSAGKTTTKEMVYSILSVWRGGFKSPGNFNNLIGLPLTILSCTENDSFLVAEMGTNLPGEIERLTEILSPQVGLITNIGPAHLEGLRDEETVAREKGMLFHGLAGGGVAVVNQDDPRVVRVASVSKARRVFYGENGKNVGGRIVRVDGEGMTVVLKYGDEVVDVFLPVSGTHFMRALLASAGVAFALGLPAGFVVEGAERFVPPDGRFRVERLGKGIVLIDDSYNANPLSFGAGFETLRLLYGEAPKVLVMGDMLELGDREAEAHERVGEMAAGLNPEFVILTGQMVDGMERGLIRAGFDEERIITCESADDAGKTLLNVLREGRVVYVKASRRVGLDRLAQAVREEFGSGEEKR